MKIIKQKLMRALVLLFALTVFAGLASALPQGPDNLTISDSGRNSLNSSPVGIQAKAGNVTALTIISTKITESWQGYYGNISGTITLDDADNFTMYDWALPSPSGEVYASNGTAVSWSDIYCMNVSGLRNNSGNPGGDILYNINASQIELNFGINITDSDGLNETFNDTYTDTTGFRVGETTINNEDGCSLAHPYTDENYEDVWNEVLLTDNKSIIFTAIIREDADSFKDSSSTETADFQLMVLENGHSGSEGSTTPYYFYVELS